MDQNEQNKVLGEDISYWAKRRYRWDEWGSPVGLGLAWALFLIPIGVFLLLLHLAGIIK